MMLSFMDPTGYSVFLFDYFINYLRKIWEASFSREHEMEADQLGLQIALAACFEMQKGISVMEKLANYQKELLNLTENRVTGWTDDHPASIERFEYLQTLLVTLLQEEKQQQRCQGMMNDLKRTGLWQSLFG
jgi:predicted Zn-dependent protease